MVAITKTKVLQVRLRFWSRGTARVVYFFKRKWVSCKTLDEARDFALSHGYGGINVTVQ